jgi:hypothetical protein
MNRIVFGIVAIVALAAMPGSVHAQLTSPANPSGYANMYNRGNQPLSPYLNLLRGTDPAVNYYYGVRPGTTPGGSAGMFGSPGSGPRQTFFPGADTLSDLTDDPRDAKMVAPTGHPAAFNNTLNYFGATAGQFYARGSQQRRPH